MTKLKDLKKERLKQAQAKKGVKMVENLCGCVVAEAERYWIVKVPLMPINQNGRPATLIAVIVQCQKCSKILDGRGEMHQKQEPLITIPGGIT